MPTKRVFSTAVVTNNQLFIIGGCDAAGKPLDSFEQFDMKKKWNRLRDMPTKRAGVAATVVGKKIVAIGGVSQEQTPMDSVEVYNLEDKTWKSMEPLGEALLGVSCVTRGEDQTIISENVLGYLNEDSVLKKKKSYSNT